VRRAELDQLRRTAALLRQARAASLDFAETYRRQVADRERQAADLGLQLAGVDERIARAEAENGS
jgi:hypothetical protein